MSGKKPGNCFTYRYNGITKFLITPAGIESARNKRDTIEIKALWDTGASRSLIREEVASQLNLQSVSKIILSTPSDKNFPSNVYLVNLYLPNQTRFRDLQVAEGVLKNYDMLIGMDVINCGDFIVSNFDMKTTFTFRMPSMKEFDFLKESFLVPITAENSKPGRNDPCPCGSGPKSSQP